VNEEIAAFVSLLPSSIDTSRTNKPGMWEQLETVCDEVADEQTRSDSAVVWRNPFVKPSLDALLQAGDRRDKWAYPLAD